MECLTLLNLGHKRQSMLSLFEIVARSCERRRLIYKTYEGKVQVYPESSMASGFAQLENIDLV